MKKSSSKIYTMTLTAIMAALLCVVGPYTVAVPISPVPLSFSNFLIALSAVSFGKKAAVWGCTLYLLIGAVGLPVFSGFSSGIGTLLGPTGGYLLGYLPLAWFCGLFSEHFPENSRKDKLGLAAGFFCGHLLLYLFGGIWLAWVTGIAFWRAMAIGAAPYLPGDILKGFLAVVSGAEIRVKILKTNHKK